MNNPFFSIIIPTYNSASVIAVCMNSIVGQGFKNFEVIIVDGRSVDETVAIVNQYRSRLPQLSCISEEDEGIYDAMNKGLKMASGEWIYFLGSDDHLYAEDSLEKISRTADASTAGMLYGNVLIDGNSIWAEHGQVYDGEYSLDKLLIRNICHQAIFYKRKLLEAMGGFNINYRICADWDLNLHFFSRHPVQYSNLIVAVFTSAGTSSAKADDEFLDRDYVKKVHSYFGISLFDKHFYNRRHLLKINAAQFLSKRQITKAVFYYCAFLYQKLKNSKPSPVKNSN